MEQIFRLPDHGPPSENEMAWIALLRDLSCGRDPAPSLAAIDALRAALTRAA